MSCNTHDRDISVQQCGNCMFHRVAQDQKGVFVAGQVECHRYPASVHIIPVPRQGLGGVTLDMQVMAVHPTHKTDNWCGEWGGI